MITELQQEQASLFALDAMSDAERVAFEREVLAKPELRSLVGELRRVAVQVAVARSHAAPGPHLKARIMAELGGASAVPQSSSLSRPDLLEKSAGLWFKMASESTGWKELPVRGAWIK